MCAVSAVGGYWKDTLPQQPYYPAIHPFLSQPAIPQISRAEFDALKRDMEELKKLLTAAKKFDDATGQPDCEMEDKVEIIRKLAKLVNVDLTDIFPK